MKIGHVTFDIVIQGDTSYRSLIQSRIRRDIELALAGMTPSDSTEVSVVVSGEFPLKVRMKVDGENPQAVSAAAAVLKAA